MDTNKMDKAALGKEVITQLAPALAVSLGLVIVNPIFTPILGVAWIMVQGLLTDKDSEIGKRLTEVLIFISKNKDFFDEKALKNPHIVSGLIHLHESIIRQRFEWKRERIFGIFLGFLNEADKENFELEKMYSILNLMSLEDLELLRKIENEFILFNTETDTSLISSMYSLYSLGLFSSPTIFDGNKFIITEFGKNFKKVLLKDINAKKVFL